MSQDDIDEEVVGKEELLDAPDIIEGINSGNEFDDEDSDDDDSSYPPSQEEQLQNEDDTDDDTNDANIAMLKPQLHRHLRLLVCSDKTHS
eukprot:4301430-Ditylum_brightwellii.AAC.1